MNILKLSPYYFPEKISSSHLTNDLEDAYIQAGHTITVYAPTPTRGISDAMYEEYKNRTYEERKDGHIRIHRFSMMREGKNPIGRALRYFLVHWKHYRRAVKTPDVDVISAGSTPPTQGMLCVWVKKKLSKKYKRNVPLVFSLQDVFPDSLANAGMTKKGSVIWKIGRKIEDYTYRNADVIIVISEDIKRNIMEKGVPEEKIRLIYNWIDTEAVHPVGKNENSLYAEFGFNRDDFHVVYAGNLGMAQGIGVILEAAEQMKDQSAIQFVIFGNGTEEETIRETIQNKQLNNVSLLPLQPAERISEVYSLGDVCVVACRKGNGVNAFPSKTVSIMATGTPVLASFDRESELCRILGKISCGICCEPEDAEGLKNAILYCATNTAKMDEMGQAARDLVVKRFGKTGCTAQYVKLLEAVVIGTNKRG